MISLLFQLCIPLITDISPKKSLRRKLERHFIVKIYHNLQERSPSYPSPAQSSCHTLVKMHFIVPHPQTPSLS